MIEERNLKYFIVDTIIWIVLALLALSCILPFIHLLSKSLSNRAAVSAGLVGLLPIGLTFDNYAFILQNRQFLGSFGISVARVIVAVISTLLLVVVTAYPLSLDRIHMPGRLAFKVIMIFGLLFSGGLIPTFLAFRNLGLLNNFLVLILPMVINIFYIIIMVNFFRGIPYELAEAAWLDGASHTAVLFKIYLPIALPALATIALFTAVAHWNSWFDGIVYINNIDQWPLQSFLYSLVSTRRINWQSASGSLDFQNATPEGLSAALIFVASVPILMVYPFLQRYFVTGLTLGSVKQ
ncbi:MAG: carbohydrate ABC transporter permease [Anaerolineae bacterium]|nr:carbohydrate ABC transporter permease [Anaerolineae bacterium]